MTRVDAAMALLVVSLLPPPVIACPVAEARCHDPDEIVVLARRRPMMVRADVTVQGRCVDALWQEYLEDFFSYLDRDDDDLLSEREFRRGPSPAHLHRQRGGGLYPRIGEPSAVVGEADRNQDGSVAFAEFAAYYREGGVGPLALVTNTHAPFATEHHTREMMRVIDGDGDGMLSSAELRRARESLARLDLNDDELLTCDEVASGGPADEGPPQPLFINRLPGGTSPPQRIDDVRAALHGRYGLPLDHDAFHRLDRPVDCSVEVSPLGGECRLDAPSRLGPHLVVPMPDHGGRVTIEVTTVQPGLAAGIRHVFLQQFAAARDARPEGSADAGPAGDRFALIRSLHSFADRNEDGELTEAEVMRCVDLHVSLLSHTVTLAVTSGHLGLFTLFDENGDGRLTLDEIHSAPDRVSQWDSDGDDLLTAAELPYDFTLQFALGQGAPRARPRGDTVPLAAAPRWFELLDRNADRRVSPREFVGSAELFRRFDRDRDGLLAPAEATMVDGETFTP
jgi:Ca2+-binding EF-hand superfamily protein